MPNYGERIKQKTFAIIKEPFDRLKLFAEHESIVADLQCCRKGFDDIALRIESSRETISGCPTSIEFDMV